MQIVKWNLAVLALILATQPAWASDSATEVEVDPIAYALSGYSVHLGEYFDGWKFDLGTASESLNQNFTNSFLGNNNFTAKFVTYGAKLDFVGQGRIGIHVGLQYDYTQWTYTSTLNNQTANNYTQDAGVRIGYRMGSGSFYIDPWVGFLFYYQGAGNVSVGSQNYNAPSVQIFPTVHVGYRF